jgi:hypothetical protein
MMDAQIGKFKVQVKESGLLLQHSMGMGFELTREEALGLLQFLQVYQQALLEQPGTTDPETQPIIQFPMNEDDQPNKPT